jgi:hypothetical protein
MISYVPFSKILERDVLVKNKQEKLRKLPLQYTHIPCTSLEIDSIPFLS